MIQVMACEVSTKWSPNGIFQVGVERKLSLLQPEILGIYIFAAWTV
jgi:hypothetical protein